MTDVTLCWENPSIRYVLLMLKRLHKRWRQVRRLTLVSYNDNDNNFALSIELLSDFIMKMEHLSYLHIDPQHDHKGQLVILRDKVNELILPRRPNFTFDISRIH
jgi:hypothetical protein